MNEKKNIDRLFQEKFKDFEVTPSDAVWDRISESLPKKKKKRRVIALWWRIGGVAAVITLLLTLGISLFTSSDDNEVMPTIVDTEKTNNSSQKGNKSNNSKDSNDTLENTPDLDLDLADSNETEASNSNEDNNSATEQNKERELTSSKNNKSNGVANTTSKEDIKTINSNKSLTELKNEDSSSRVASSNKNSENQLEDEIINDSEIKSIIESTVKDKNSAVTDNESSNYVKEASNSENNKELEKDTSLLKEDNEKESILDAIASNNNNEEDIDEKEKEDEQNRWSIAPNVAPVYYSSLGQGSSIDQQFNNNSKRGDVNMSYGITGSYTISDKLKVRAGINRVNLSQSTSNVIALNGSVLASRNATEENVSVMGNVSARDGYENITFMSGNMLDSNTTPEIFNSKIFGNIDQRFGFIEVPLELEYRLLDRKFGLNIVGGFSTLFLNRNEIYADINGTSTLIGEANNMNSTSFSANFGLGLDYSLSKQWNFNLEPQFKYQINTFNNTSGNYRPFFIGLYTGLSYKF